AIQGRSRGAGGVARDAAAVLDVVSQEADVRVAGIDVFEQRLSDGQMPVVHVPPRGGENAGVVLLDSLGGSDRIGRGGAKGDDIGQIAGDHRRFLGVRQGLAVSAGVQVSVAGLHERRSQSGYEALAAAV